MQLQFFLAKYSKQIVRYFVFENNFFLGTFDKRILYLENRTHV